MTAVETLAPTKPRILIVEDEGVVAWDMERSLRDAYDVTGVAGTAEEALDRAARDTPDLVLMDIRIRGDVDGISAAELLRARHNVPVVYLTAHGDNDTMERARKTDPYGYLLKPFKRPDLLSAVSIALYRHRMERELSAREHLLATTLHSIGEGVVMGDAEGRVTMMNAAAEKLTGYAPGEAVGQRVNDVVCLVDEATKKALDVGARRAVETKAPVAIDGALATGRSGHERAVLVSTSPIVDGGAVLGTVTVLRDVSQARHLQRQLEFADRLASLGTMAAGVAHEINNPLAFIVANIEHAAAQLESHLEILQARGLDPLAAPLRDVVIGLQEAREGSTRIARIVSDLRSFTRDDRRREKLVDLRESLEWAISVTGHVTRHRAEIVRALGPVPKVSADEARLSQVFVNLLVNAAQAIEPGKPAVNTIRVMTRTLANGQAEIEIEDTGSGMGPEVTARIFEPFFTTKPIGGGTGLGLSICHGIVTSLGGTIELSSQPGVGSRFTVRLPAARANESSSGTPPSASRIAAATARKRVLIVDDDAFVRIALQRILQMRHDVVAAASVQEALTAIAMTQFDVVFCDVVMPGESGLDFDRKLRVEAPELAARVVYLTGGAFSADVSAFLETVRKLEKPFEAGDLQRMVDEVAGSKG